ncbi:MAG: hypothetical protein MJ252_31165 [archaeon]|nr:hypothetical protein [archaeon]
MQTDIKILNKQIQKLKYKEFLSNNKSKKQSTKANFTSNNTLTKANTKDDNSKGYYLNTSDSENKSLVLSQQGSKMSGLTSEIVLKNSLINTSYAQKYSGKRKISPKKLNDTFTNTKPSKQDFLYNNYSQNKHKSISHNKNIVKNVSIDISENDENKGYAMGYMKKKYYNLNGKIYQTTDYLQRSNKFTKQETPNSLHQSNSIEYPKSFTKKKGGLLNFISKSNKKKTSEFTLENKEFKETKENQMNKRISKIALDLGKETKNEENNKDTLNKETSNTNNKESSNINKEDSKSLSAIDHKEYEEDKKDLDVADLEKSLDIIQKRLDSTVNEKEIENEYGNYLMDYFNDMNKEIDILENQEILLQQLINNQKES